MAETYTLYDLNEYIRRVIALNFPESLWITCEIASIKNSRGNYYLELVQQNDEEEVIAQSGAALWYRNFLFLKSKLGGLIDSILAEGVSVRLKVNVDFNERYGMKLIIEDIDATFTLGQMELARQKIIERLKKEGVTELNKKRRLPSVLQRLAVISAENAAGYIDFTTHLQNNAFGYVFQIKLFQAALQGSNTEKEVIQALKEIQGSGYAFDAVILIRGGGSKLDLAAFDNFNIGMEIAQFPLPILTGIGHEIDDTIADFVSHASFKTPTAVANFILDRNQMFETDILSFYDTIGIAARQRLSLASEQIKYLVGVLDHLPRNVIEKHQLTLSHQEETVKQLTSYYLQREKRQLEAFETMMKLSDPTHVLKRGFTYVQQEGKYITKAGQVTQETEAELIFHDGVRKIKFPG